MPTDVPTTEPTDVPTSGPSARPEDAPIRVAIVGTGGIARAHAEAIAAEPDLARLVAGVDVDPVRLQEFCDAHAIPGRHTDLRTMLELENPALVQVCTPPGTHVELAANCLRSGVSVLVEKPPAPSLAGFDELAGLQGDPAGPWFATVFQHRFGSGARRLQSLVTQGVLGRPLVAVCHTLWFRDQAYFDVPWRGSFRTEGGGPTMGHGIHQLDLMAAVLGDWTRVRAGLRRQARRTGTEDLSYAHVEFANGAVASVVNSVVSPRQESCLRFDFEYATVEVSHLYGYGDDDWTITPAPGHEAILESWQAAEFGQRSGHPAQIRQVLKALRAGVAPPVTAAESRRTLGMVAAIYASAFEDRAIVPADLGPDSPWYTGMDGSTTALDIAEPRPDAGDLDLVESGSALRISFQGRELARYVHRPTDPPLESPRPYLHPVRTLDGASVSLFRPHDHLWHKGIALSLANVGSQNFWGGVTYVRGEGYRQLDNNGRVRHDGFESVEVVESAASVEPGDLAEVGDSGSRPVGRVVERLTWVASSGEPWLVERRTLVVRVVPADDEASGLPRSWRLGFSSTLENVSGAPIPFGSPTTQGRPDAGYSGLFWRGPRSFSGGRVITPDAEGGDELMGVRAPWLAYIGRHDDGGTLSTLVFHDDPANFSYPSKWFVRTGVYACVCPAPFFDEEYVLAGGASLSLAYAIDIADGALDRAICERLAGARDE